MYVFEHLCFMFSGNLLETSNVKEYSHLMLLTTVNTS